MARVDGPDTKSSGRTSILHFWKHYLLAACLLAAVALGAPRPWMIFAAGVVLAHALAIILLGTRWWVTDEQVVQSKGVVSRHTTELSLRDLGEVQVRQGWIGRWLDVGSVRVSAPGSASGLELSGVRSPRRLASLLRELSGASREDPDA